VVRRGGQVTAEALVEPARWSELSFRQGGTVAAVLVEEGAAVKEGDVLLRLNSAAAELAVQEAQAALELAEAELAETEAGTRPEELAIREAQLKAAQARLAQAQAEQQDLQAGKLEVAVADAEAALAQAQVDEWYAGDLHKVEGWRVFDDPKLQMNVAVSARAAAEAQVAAAKAAAPVKLHTAETGVWAAAAQRNVAQAQMTLAQAGPTAEELALAEAKVVQAAAALQEAQTQSERLSLRAPFAGVVTQLVPELGETVQVGEVAAVVATLDELQIVTTDLTELDVIGIAPEQVVEVEVDALPGKRWTGHVTKVDLQSVENRGDVTYPVTIVLDEAAPELRWGMTVQVTVGN
jgi:HlyD family secretion protein